MIVLNSDHCISIYFNHWIYICISAKEKNSPNILNPTNQVAFWLNEGS